MGRLPGELPVSVFDTLRSIGACSESLEWVAAQPDQSPAALWATCPRGDWLARYLGALGARVGHGSTEHRRAVMAVCRCAGMALPHAGPWRKEVGHQMDHVEAWAYGRPADLAPAHGRLREIRRAVLYTAPLSTLAAIASAVYTVAYATTTDATAASSATIAVADADAATDVSVLADATNPTTWVEARNRRLAYLANMIRGAIPEAP